MNTQLEQMLQRGWIRTGRRKIDMPWSLVAPACDMLIGTKMVRGDRLFLLDPIGVLEAVDVGQGIICYRN